MHNLRKPEPSDEIKITRGTRIVWRLDHHEITRRDAIAVAAATYSASVFDQMNRAIRRGDWPDRVDLRPARTPAHIIALDRVVIDLRRAFPELRIGLRPRFDLTRGTP